MASIFGKDPSKWPAPPAFARERIEKEIAHLKKPPSTRHLANERKALGALVCFVLAGLYLMDPFFFAWYKGNAVKAYLYLHNYGDEQKARALAACGILTPLDVDVLNDRHGSYQDYYVSLQDAGKDADAIIRFKNGLAKLRTGPYGDLDPLGKLRYNLFCRWGLLPPTEWPALNPTIKDEETPPPQQAAP